MVQCMSSPVLFIVFLIWMLLFSDPEFSSDSFKTCRDYGCDNLSDTVCHVIYG